MMVSLILQHKETGECQILPIMPFPHGMSLSNWYLPSDKLTSNERKREKVSEGEKEEMKK